ncbi:unnamed protein product [Adineta ricciae]|uniref:Uncharacterized protein n=1 Tax=Adineta ricciae TaxID=249248 RepID=A0A815F5V8_ADIRI|nr:unnamed protein product [Adineta ricciae]CAF1320654.1 unnamed protein product [Adineta ricciae]
MARQFYVFSVILLLVLCEASIVLSRTTACANPVNCLINPCQGATCKNYPNAVCRANYCGGCNRTFYVGCKKVECG